MTNRIMPAGLDQQGRYETRPMPAEAASEFVTNEAFEELVEVVDGSMRRFGALIVALSALGVVFLGYLIAGGAHDLLTWARGLL